MLPRLNPPRPGFSSLPMLAVALGFLLSGLVGTTAREPGASAAAIERLYSSGPASAWVRPRTPDFSSPPPFSGPIRPGIYFRLVDYQANADTEEEYYHYATEYLSSAGVHEQSEFDIEFDPAYQELVIHRILRHRDGETADIFDPDVVRITIPEDERVDGLLDGHVSVMVLLEDIRPGDRVEYDYTLKGTNPVFDGRFFDAIPMEWETTVAEVSYRLLRKKDRPALLHRGRGFDSKPAVRSLEGTDFEEWTWTREKVAPRIVEEQLPGWFQPFARLELSEFADWGEVARWGARHYDFADLPVIPELAAEIDRIRRAHDSPEARAMAAIHFVQDEIRYLGIEDGTNAFRPVQPNQCFRRRFGDCKDKAVLLGQMLRELGIESDPVCVAHAWKHTIADMLPSPLAFDHVVLRIRLPDGRVAWCDATDSHQGGGFDDFAFPDYGVGLVLDESTDDLTACPAIDPERDRIEVRESLAIGEIGEPTLMNVETTYRGAEADGVRYHFQSTEPEELRHTYLDYYRETYPAIEPVGTIEMDDDRAGNRLVVRERYRLPDPWTADTEDVGWYVFTLYLQTIRDQLVQPDHSRRTMPFAIGPPKSCRHELHLDLPGTDDDWAGYFEDDHYVIESSANRFERWMTYDSQTVEATIVSTYLSRADAVLPADLATYAGANADIYELTALDLWEVDEEEEAAALAEGGGDAAAAASIADMTEDDVALAIVFAIGAVFAGLLGFGLGALVTFLFLRRRTRRGAPVTETSGSSPASRGGGGPPPLPSAAQRGD